MGRWDDRVGHRWLDPNSLDRSCGTADTGHQLLRAPSLPSASARKESDMETESNAEGLWPKRPRLWVGLLKECGSPRALRPYRLTRDEKERP